MPVVCLPKYSIILNRIGRGKYASRFSQLFTRNFKVMTSKDLQWRIKTPGYQNIIIQRPIKNVPFLVLVLKDPYLYLQIPVHTVL